jgi:hypothetical protein
VRYKVLPVPETLIGDYYGEKTFRRKFQEQLNTFWEKKDKEIDQLLKEHKPST